MGTDIYLFVERKTPQGWEAVGGQGEYYDDRHYLLFAHLAGVRNSTGVTPIAEPRGLPDDVSATVLEFMGAKIAGQWSNGFLDRSWLSLTELASHRWPDELSEWRDVVLPRISQLATADPDDVRVVFAFD